jgi:hypothetical protein
MGLPIKYLFDRACVGVMVRDPMSEAARWRQQTDKPHLDNHHSKVNSLTCGHQRGNTMVYLWTKDDDGRPKPFRGIPSAHGPWHTDLPGITLIKYRVHHLNLNRVDNDKIYIGDTIGTDVAI